MRRVIIAVGLVLAGLVPFAPALAITYPPSIFNPSVFSLPTTIPRVDGATGAFTQHIAIDIPPGRNGLQPDLSLDYNSQNTDNDNIVGYGWTLSTPYIARLNKTGSQNLYYSGAYFTSSLDGELISASTTNSSTFSTLVNHLVSYWKFDESSGNASDSVGSNTLTNQGTATYAAAKINNGIQLNGSSQYFSASDNSTFHPAQFSIAAWFKSSSFSAGQPIIEKDYNGTWSQPYLSFMIRIDSASNIEYGLSNGTTYTNNVYTGTTLSTGTWYHIAETYDGSTVRLYLNGSQVDSFAYSSAVGYSTGNFNVGHNAGGQYFNGTIDEAGLWSRALTAGEISQLYNSGAGAQYPFPSTITNSGATSYLARIDDGSYRQYAYATSTNSWTMYDKHGTEYLFGASSQSQQSATSSTNNVYKWMLEKVIDANGNYIRYTYNKDGNQIYPYQIIYTGNGVSDGPAVITFATSTRTDAHSSYKTGFHVWTKYVVSKITAAFNGSNVRQYNLSYTPGSNGVRALLSSIQESGWDDNNNLTTLPATTFSYINASSTQFYAPSSIVSINGQSYQVADTKGDGINAVNNFYFNNLTSATGSDVVVDQNTLTHPVPPDYWSTTSGVFSPVERGVRYLDVNGDGKADVVHEFYNYTSNITNDALYLNTYSTSTGYGWTATTTWNGVIPTVAEDGSGTIHGQTYGIFADVNGDGLPDFEQRVDGASIPSDAYLGNGSAWDAATTTIFAPPKSFSYVVTPDGTNSQLFDVNGDGLPDWIYSDSGNTYVLLNTGTGWEAAPDPQWTISTTTLFLKSGSYYDRGVRFFDMNGDGLPDYIHSYSGVSGSPGAPEVATYSKVYLNTGQGWATTSASYTLPSSITSVSSGGAFTFNEYANWTGNGQMDQDVISTVTFPKGGSTDVTYGYTTQSNGANPQLPYALLVATKVVNHNGQGDSEETDFSYSGGFQYLTSFVPDRKFAGFASSTESTSVHTVVTYYSQGATTTSMGDQADGYAQLNHPYRKDTLSPSNTLTQKIFYRYDAYGHGNSTFVGLGRQVEQDYAPNGTHRDKATDYVYATTTDDLLQQIDYGEVTGNSDGTFSTSTSLGTPHTTFLTYAASSAINLSVPVEKLLVSSTSATTTDMKLFYDSLPFGQVNLGNLTQEQDWTTGTHYASSTKQYNSYGLVSSSTDRNGNATTYVYDTFNLYPATTTNALNQSTTYTYEYANGKVLQSKDPNGALLKSLYDGVGRVTEVDQSDITSPSTFVTKGTLQYTDSTTTLSSVHETDYLTSATTTHVYDYYDGLGRLEQERKSSETNGTYAVTDRLYDTAGNLSAKSFPYFSSGSSLTATTTTSALYTNFTYDPLDRVATTTNAAGSSNNSYFKWTVTTTDPDGNIRDSILDPYGNLASVVEHGSSLATTTYTYDSANKLTKLTDASGNVRDFTYDGLGRRLTAEDLHAPGHSYASSTYSYDDQGNETSRNDPKNQTVTHTHDALNRTVTESWTGHGTQITNTYDSCTNGIGHLCTASSTGALTSYAYDVLGRATAATTTIGGNGYGLYYGYDRQGNVTNLTNANGAQLAFNYNLAGLVTSVSRTNGATNLIANLLNYQPTNQFGKILFASGASTTYAYDPIFRPNQIITYGTGTTTIGPVNATLLSNIVSYWKFDESSGNASDATGTNALTNQGSATFGTGKINNAAQLNGTSQYFSVTDNSTLHPAQFTIAAWFKSSSFAAGQPIIEKDYNGTWSQPYLSFMIRIDSASSIEYGLSNGTTYTNSSYAGATLSTGTWYHVAETYDGATVRLYLNGSQVDSFAYSSAVGYSTGNFNVGHNAGGQFFNGSIDEAGLWSRALSAGEITELYNSGAGSGYSSWSAASSTQQTILQNTQYAYDPASNILTRIDAPNVGPSQTVAYTYDSLNRLLSASTTAASTLPYNQVFSYDLLGNLLTGSAGTYTYGQTGNANPDAATQLSQTLGASAATIAYDNSTLGGNGVNASSLTFSHTTNSNTSGLIVVGVLEATSAGCTADKVTGVTYNGTALTDLGYYVSSATNGTAIKTYYGYAPSLGANNVVVSASASCVRFATVTTYTGAKQSGMPDASGTGNPLADSGAVLLVQATTTPVSLNAWPIMIAAPATTTSLLGNNLASYWAFDGNGNDSKGSNNLTNQGSATFGTGKINNAAQLNGTSQYFSDTDNSTLHPAQFTIAAWFKSSSFSAGQPVIEKDYNGTWANPYLSFMVRINNSSTIEYGLSDGTNYSNNTYTGTTLSTGTWYHVAETYDGATVRLYLNGTLASSFAYSSAVGYSTGVFNVGHDGGSQYFNGSIDEAGLWSRALSAYDISQLYNSGAGYNPSGLSAFTVTAGPQTTFRAKQDGVLYYSDSNTPISQAFGLSWTTPSAAHWSANYFTIAPLTSSAGTTYTTTYSYDPNGDLTQSSITDTKGGATTTTYAYDYLNRLTGERTTGDSATTTYAYDAFGNRVSQVVNGVTTLYPSKFYSITSTTTGATTKATSTEYIFSGDTLLATVDQPMVNGLATGTAATSYVHPDNLGSTNVISNASGTLSTAKDYYPYVSVRIKTGSASLKRGYIEQFEDSSGLSYLNARYYDGSRGQFLSQDPIFLGDPRKQIITDPQSLNSYSYSEGNPITKSDPSGKCVGPFIELLPACIGAAAGFTQTAAENPNATLLQLAIGTGSGFVQGLLAEERALVALTVGGLQFGTSLLQDVAGGQNPDLLKALGNATGAVGGKTAVTATRAIGDTILTSLGVQATRSGPDVVQTLLNQSVDSGYSAYTTSILLPSITAQGGVTTIQYANGPGFKISSNSQSQTASSGGGSSAGGFTAGGMVFTPGLLPRSASPVGQTSSGAPVYCWGICH
jgi:RHS repeat-associated protein